MKQVKKVTGFRALYFHYCYLLGVFPQKQNRPPRWVPHALREDLIRAQELTDEARLLSRHHIDTLEQLNVYQFDLKSRLSSITEQRKSLYRKLRTKAVLADPAQQEHIRAEISELSAQIKELRREVKLCGGYCPCAPLLSRIRYRPPVRKSPAGMRKPARSRSRPGGSPRKRR